MPVQACVEEAKEESQVLLGLEPTWEELKDQLVLSMDALSASAPHTSPAQVTALDLEKLSRRAKWTLRNIRSLIVASSWQTSGYPR